MPHTAKMLLNYLSHKLPANALQLEENEEDVSHNFEYNTLLKWRINSPVKWYETKQTPKYIRICRLPELFS